MTATVAPQDTDRRARLAEVARVSGAAAALRSLYDRAAPDGAVVGPGGHAVVPEERTVAGEPVPLPWLSGSGVRAWRGLGPATVDRYPGWLLDLAWLRLGLARGLLHATTAYLAGRRLAGRQLVQADLADVLSEHLTVLATLDDARASTSDSALADAHARLSTADRALLRLHGAGGYTVAGPGRDAFVSELLADVYLPTPEGYRG